ncbi:MAG: hypothetical protein KDI92_12780 [Xanthomonadales bacterium]|nr:hypothetical protein [Xanthomonadales bacterium]
MQWLQKIYWILSSCYLVTSGMVLAQPFSDDFDTPNNLLNDNATNWSVLGAGVMDERATQIEIVEGHLQVVPERFEFNGWFEDEYGPLVYQNVTGNFVAMTRLQVFHPDNDQLPPNVGFNAGGFVIRDAAGTHNGDENWVMYNMGGQGVGDVTYSREVKKTVNSTSNLFLTEQIGLDEYLLVCRVGSHFYFYYWADAINDWREERYYNAFDVDGVLTTTWHNSSSVTPEVIPAGTGQSNQMFFNHAAMPATVQVGVMGHTWSDDAIQANFDFVYFSQTPPNNQSECLQEFAIPDLIFADNFE